MFANTSGRVTGFIVIGLLAVLFFYWFSSNPNSLAPNSLAQEGSTEELDLAILEQRLATPQSPLLWAAEFENLEAVQQDNTNLYQITLFDVSYAGQDLDTLQFEVTPLNTSQISVSNIALPASFSFRSQGLPYSMKLEGFNASGIYNLQSGAYERLTSQIDRLEISDDSETLKFWMEDISDQNRFDPETNSLVTDSRSGLVKFSIESLSTKFDGQIPWLSIKTQADGYENNQNPMIELGQQISSIVSSLGLLDPSGETPAIPLTFLVSDNYSFEMQTAPITLNVEDIDNVAMNMGAITGEGTINNMLDPNNATGKYTFSIDGFEIDDAGTQSQLGTKAIKIVYELSGMDYTPGSPLYSTELYNSTPSTYAPFADMIGAVGRIESTVEITDFSYSDLFSEFGFGTLEFGTFFDATSDQGELGISVDLSKVFFPNSDQGLLNDLVPTDTTINLSFVNLDLPALAEALRQFTRSGSIGNEATLNTDILLMLPQLSNWWAASGVKFIPELLYQSPISTLQAEGELPFSPDAIYGISGTLNASLKNYDLIQERISGAMDTGTPADQQLASTLLFPLGMLGGFGEVQDDGSLNFALKLSPSGSITVNGLPLPF